MLKIYTLEYCSYCKALLASLDEEGIEYITLDADSEMYEQGASMLEALLDTALYPIAVLTKDGSTIYFSSSDKEGVLRAGNGIAYRYESIPHLVKLIQKFL